VDNQPQQLKIVSQAQYGFFEKRLAYMQEHKLVIDPETGIDRGTIARALKEVDKATLPWKAGKSVSTAPKPQPQAAGYWPGTLVNAKEYDFLPGNSAATNTTNWNTMMAAVGDNAAIEIDPGTYQHSGLVIENADNLHIRGLSGAAGIYGGVLLMCTVASAHGLHAKKCSNLRLENLWSGHSIASDSGIAAFRLDGMQFGSFDRLSTWDNTPHTKIGCQLVGNTATQNSFENWFSNCVFVNHPDYGMYLAADTLANSVGETTLTNCFIWDNGVTGLVAGLHVADFVYGLYVRSGTSFSDNYNNVDIVATASDRRVVDIFFSDCILDNPAVRNFYAQNTESVHLIGNWISEGAGCGKNIVQATTGEIFWEIIGNIIQGGTTALELANDRAQIHNNIISVGVGGTKGIDLLAGSSNCFLSGNMLVGWTTPITDAGTSNIWGANYVHGLSWTRPDFRKGVQIGSDTNFYLDLLAGAPTHTFDANDYVEYDRSNNLFRWFIGGGTPKMTLGGGVSGETPLVLVDITTGTARRVTIDNSDLGTGAKRYLYLA
jgi:hypothetical protein